MPSQTSHNSKPTCFFRHKTKMPNFPDNDKEITLCGLLDDGLKLRSKYP